METTLEAPTAADYKPQFDTTAEIVRVMRTASAGKTEVIVRWPSDELWSKRSMERKHLTKVLGRGQQIPEVEEGDSDLNLYNATRVDGSPDLTAAEATMFFNQLARASVRSLDLGSDDAVVKLSVMNGIEVTHTLRIPSAQQAKDTAKAMDRFVGHPHSTFVNTLKLEPAAHLWAQLSPRVEGYLHNSVPIIHKDAVIRELFMALEREAAEGAGETDF